MIFYRIGKFIGNDTDDHWFELSTQALMTTVISLFWWVVAPLVLIACMMYAMGRGARCLPAIFRQIQRRTLRRYRSQIALIEGLPLPPDVRDELAALRAVKDAAVRLCEVVPRASFPELRSALGPNNPPGRSC